jgi:hypothetical protein
LAAAPGICGVVELRESRHLALRLQQSTIVSFIIACRICSKSATKFLARL